MPMSENFGPRTESISPWLDLVSACFLELRTNCCLMLVFRTGTYLETKLLTSNYSPVEDLFSSPIYLLRSRPRRDNCKTGMCCGCVKLFFIEGGLCSAGHQKSSCDFSYRPPGISHDAPSYCVVNQVRRYICGIRMRGQLGGPIRC